MTPEHPKPAHRITHSEFVNLHDKYPESLVVYQKKSGQWQWGMVSTLRWTEDPAFLLELVEPPKRPTPQRGQVWISPMGTKVELVMPARVQGFWACRDVAGSVVRMDVSAMEFVRHPEPTRPNAVWQWREYFYTIVAEGDGFCVRTLKGGAGAWYAHEELTRFIESGEMFLVPLFPEVDA